MRVGFIGLGNVGSKLAESLLRNGFDLVVRDLDRSAVDCPVSGRVSSGRHRQHLQLRRVRPVYFRADPACPGHHGPPHSAHRSGGLSLDPQGGHQLPGHRQPGVPV